MCENLRIECEDGCGCTVAHDGDGLFVLSDDGVMLRHPWFHYPLVGRAFFVGSTTVDRELVFAAVTSVTVTA